MSLLLNSLIPLAVAVTFWVFQYKDKDFTMSDFFTLLIVGILIYAGSYFAVTRTADRVAKDCVFSKDSKLISFYQNQKK